MTFSPEQVSHLTAKLDPKHVSQRSQAGRSLSYVEGWHVIAEANRIFGFDAWDRETVELRQLGEPREVDGKWRVAYMARVRVKVRPTNQLDAAWWVIRDGCGYGSGIDRDMGSAHESALKEAETDAMKRALMTFGNPFGLALYDKTQASVGVEEKQKPSGDFDVTAAGRKRRRGPRLTDPHDVESALNALVENLRKQSNPDALKTWAKGQAAMIGSLPDPQFDDFMSVFDETVADLTAERMVV